MEKLHKKTILLIGEISFSEQIKNEYSLQFCANVDEGLSALEKQSDKIVLTLIEGNMAVDGDTLCKLSGEKSLLLSLLTVTYLTRKNSCALKMVQANLYVFPQA